MPAVQEQEKDFNLVKDLLNKFERHPVVETPTSPEVPTELKGYIEKVETSVEVKPPTTIQVPGNYPTVKPQPSVVLPLTASQYASAKKTTVFDSVRWLAVWCLRLFKIYGSRASFRPEPNL